MSQSITRVYQRRGGRGRTCVTISLSFKDELRAQEVALALDRLKAHAATSQCTFSEVVADAIMEARKRLYATHKGGHK